MHCQQVVSLNLATPDARHRRPLKVFLYHPSVKSPILGSLSLSFSGDREAKFHGIFASQCFLGLCG
jgi:hypothetical protein